MSNGLTIIENTYGNGIVSFSIEEGLEAEAGIELLSIIHGRKQVSLSNDLDEGLEGQTSFRHQGNEYEYKEGGHGWSGSWKKINKSDLLVKITELSRLNRGGLLSGCGNYR